MDFLAGDPFADLLAEFAQADAFEGQIRGFLGDADDIAKAGSLSQPKIKSGEEKWKNETRAKRSSALNGSGGVLYPLYRSA